jgi:GNAT superfamily N-acetyltransferase
MNKQEAVLLLEGIHPNFFQGENIRNLGEECVFEEMIMPLEHFDADKYNKKLDGTVSFGYYNGEVNELLEAVKKVIPDWVEYYRQETNVYCGYINGNVASFCIVEDMGTHNISGRKIKVGGPGCVGTLPEYRDKGIGLTMVQNVTGILKDRGYDYSYIHYTGVAPWYGKLGYKTLFRWNKYGILE